MHTATVEQTSTVGSTPVENEAQALHRLARQAKAQRVKIIVNVETNAHFAASVSRPGTLHKVTLYSCDCPGFLKHARCMHYAAVLEMYHSLPPIEGPDTSGPDSGPDGGGAALPVPTDVVVSVVPAPRRQGTTPRLEGAYVAHAGTRSDGSTYVIRHADAVVLDGVPHRVGDAVLVTDKRWGWLSARLTCIRTTGATGKVWKVDVDGLGYGETTRSLSEVRALGSEATSLAA